MPLTAPYAARIAARSPAASADPCALAGRAPCARPAPGAATPWPRRARCTPPGSRRDALASRTGRCCGLALVLVLALAGCSAPRLPGVYRIDIQQGNVVTQEMLDRLEPGMAKRKVRLVLGTPLIADPFNQQRWDYIYTFLSGSGELTRRRISLYFRDQRLDHIEGDVRTGKPGTRSAPPRREEVVTVPPREKTGFLDRLTPGFLKRDKGGGRAEPPPGGGEQAGVAPGGPAAEIPAEAQVPPVPPVEAPAAKSAPETGPGAGEAVEAAGTASPSAAEGEDSSLLKRLFRRFRTSPEEDAGEAGGESGRAEEQAAGAGSEPGGERTGAGDGTAGAASSEDDGFFSRLMRRFRRPAASAQEPAAEQQPSQE